jgi:hypothetical protein
MEPIISSFIFTTNVITAYLYKQYYIYSLLFLILTITSFFYHSNSNIYTNIIDKCAIGGIVFYGAYMLYNKFNMNKLLEIILIFACFFSILFLFFYGYYNKKYCYDPEWGNYYHGLLHFISSLGHHIIIFL